MMSEANLITFTIVDVFFYLLSRLRFTVSKIEYREISFYHLYILSLQDDYITVYGGVVGGHQY